MDLRVSGNVELIDIFVQPASIRFISMSHGGREDLVIAADIRGSRDALKLKRSISLN